MTKPGHHFILTAEDLIKARDAALVLEELDAAHPGEMTEFFHAAHYWDLLESLRDVLKCSTKGMRRNTATARPCQK